MRPVAALAWPVVPEREAQDSVLLRPPLPQAQPKAESFSSVWLLELSGNIFWESSIQTCVYTAIALRLDRMAFGSCFGMPAFLAGAGTRRVTRLERCGG